MPGVCNGWMEIHACCLLMAIEWMMHGLFVCRVDVAGCTVFSGGMVTGVLPTAPRSYSTTIALCGVECFQIEGLVFIMEDGMA